MNTPPVAELDMSGFGLAVMLLSVAALGFWWWRNRGGAGPQGPIRLVGMRPLGAKRALALIEVGEERFLLGMTDAQISCLGKLEGGTERALAAAKGDAA